MDGRKPGRPKKENEDLIVGDVSETPIPLVEAEVPAIKVRVITVGDYMAQARELFGVDRVWENAVVLLYSNNKVLAVLDRKGEQKFVVEA